MDELLRIVVLGLEWFALRLEDSPLQVAWPLFFVLVFQVFLFAVHGLQWFSRGIFLPIACDYPRTTSKGKGPCKNRALGEWHRCHLHRRSWRRRTDSHLVDPKLPRWMTIERGVHKERRDRYGEGSLRARSRSIGLLTWRCSGTWPPVPSWSRSWSWPAGSPRPAGPSAGTGRRGCGATRRPASSRTRP